MATTLVAFILPQIIYRESCNCQQSCCALMERKYLTPIKASIHQDQPESEGEEGEKDQVVFPGREKKNI